MAGDLDTRFLVYSDVQGWMPRMDPLATVGWNMRQPEIEELRAEMPSKEQFRYRVVSAWGGVPSDISEMIEKPDCYLLYDQYLGRSKDETIVDLSDGHFVGGWSMRYVDKT